MKADCVTQGILASFLLSLSYRRLQTIRFWSNKGPTVQFSSVAQSCPTLCDPMNHSTPGLPFHHKLLQFAQTHAHRVSDAIQPSHWHPETGTLVHVAKFGWGDPRGLLRLVSIKTWVKWLESLITFLLYHLIKVQGFLVSCQRIKPWLQTVVECNPCFPNEGSFDLEIWHQVKEKVERAIRQGKKKIFR